VVTSQSPSQFFDHHAPEHADDPWRTFRALRTTCPVVHSTAHGGFKIITRYADIVEVAKDWRRFSSEHDIDGTTHGYGGVTIPSPPIRSIPVELDPPEHTKYRKLLNPFFGAENLARRRPRIAAIAAHFVDEVIESGRCDPVNDICVPIPAAVTLELLGIPTERWEQYAVPMHQVVYAPPDSPAYQEALAGCAWMLGDVAAEITRRRTEPPTDGDMLGVLMQDELDGAPLSDQTILEIAWLVISGGLDNTASLLSNALLWLNEHPVERARLQADPTLTQVAFAEFLRYFSPTLGESRTATCPTTVAGYPIDEGERVYIAWGSGNRDPDAFEDPDELRLERRPSRHLGFGWGPHRCIGSALGEELFVTALNEVLRRMPDYEIVQATKYPSVALIYGYVAMDATFTPGARSVPA
jgi:cytochrome P450